MRIGISYLRRSRYGIDVRAVVEGQPRFVKNVPENIVRCALGESDMDYLLETDCDESNAFSVTQSEYSDFCRMAQG